MTDIQLLTFADQHYPHRLKEIPSSPKQLFLKGDQKLLSSQHLIAVVGTRQISTYGKKVLMEIIPALVRSGAVIVSGLAYGVDGLAHQIALDHGGKCIAVLGNGLDEVYPREHRSLAQRIILSGGAIISEHDEGVPPLKQHFPARNRIISGLSKAVLVIEAKQKSGSLITADFALDQGRELYAVPGNIFSASQEGTNQLIAHGARPILSAEDLLNSLSLIPADAELEPVIPQLHFASETEESLFSILKDIKTIDDLIRELQLPISTLNQTLMQMEIKGLIKNLGGMSYCRI